MSALTRFMIRFLICRAGWVVGLTLVLGGIGGAYSVRLFSNLRTDLEELLPEAARSVKDLDEVRSRLETTSSLAILMISEDTAASKRFVDDLASGISALPRSVSAGVEYRIDRELEFFKKRKSLFVDLQDLRRIRDYIKDRIQYELTLYNPLTIVENKSIEEPRLDFKALEKKYTSMTGPYARFEDGYYATPDKKQRVILANLPGNKSGISASKDLREAVDGILARLNPKSYAPDLEVHFAGGAQDLIDEHEALVEDLLLSTVVVCILVSLAMGLYFRSVSGTLALILALLIGTLWTFGAGYFQVGYLNANSAFMASIVIGNGINFGIILLARFLEERQKRKDVPRSIYLAVRRTVPATGVAALAAGLAYGSLWLTSFRGFRQFGIIGFTGMVLCWLATYSFLPSFLVLLHRAGWVEKWRPKPRKPLLSRGLEWLVGRHYPAILGITLLATVASAASLVRIGPELIETNMKKLRNIKSAESGSMYWGEYVDKLFDRYLLPVVALPRKEEDVAKIAQAVRKVKQDEGDQSFIVSVSTLDDFIPKMQAEKVAVLHEIDQLLPRQLLAQLNPRERLMAQDLLSEGSFQRFGVEDLPPLVRDKFRERDGTLGKLVLIEPSLSPELQKSENLIHFVGSVREAVDRIAPGTAVAGTLPVTSDLFESILRDGPQATFFAFVAVLLLVVLLFRDKRTILFCSFSLLIGVLWLFGYILIFGQKINFLNFIALPITFGIGVDYGVNVFQRYRLEHKNGILPVLRQTGGAVLLASFTTITGYGSLLIASNQAFVSFGKLAVLGEVTCVFAAILSLPALIHWMEKKAGRS
jgi:predicted RND superfamily exporter protein